MRIAVLVYDLSGIGGIAKHMFMLCHEYAALGHDVEVWSVIYNPENCYADLTSGFKVHGLRSGSLRLDAPSYSLPGRRLLAYLWKLKGFYQDQARLANAIPGGYDVLHPHGNIISWSAAAYKRRHGTPVVWLCNDFWPLGGSANGHAGSKRGEIKMAISKGTSYPFARYDRKAVRAIDRITVMSEQVQAQMAAYYGITPIIVRTGVESERFAVGNRQRIRSLYQVEDDTQVLLTVGILMPRRRIEDGIRAVRQLVDAGRKVMYLIVGRTSHDPAYTAFIQNEIAALDLASQVKLVGEVPDNDLVDYFHAGDAFLWTSDASQSWGRAATEAMASGIPPIVSQANGLAEVLEDGRTALLVPSESPEAIARAVTRFMDTPGLAKQIGQAAQQLIRDRYSWAREAEAMVNLFREVTSR